MAQWVYGCFVCLLLQLLSKEGDIYLEPEFQQQQSGKLGWLEGCTPEIDVQQNWFMASFSRLVGMGVKCNQAVLQMLLTIFWNEMITGVESGLAFVSLLLTTICHLRMVLCSSYVVSFSRSICVSEYQCWVVIGGGGLLPSPLACVASLKHL